MRTSPNGCGGDELFGCGHGQWTREPKALAVRTLHPAQPIHLVGRLDALRDHADTEAVGKIENGLDNGARFAG